MGKGGTKRVQLPSMFCRPVPCSKLKVCALLMSRENSFRRLLFEQSASITYDLCAVARDRPINQSINQFLGCLSKQRSTETFLARDSMLSALYAIARPSVCLSVCLSVRHTGGSVKNG